MGILNLAKGRMMLIERTPEEQKELKTQKKTLIRAMERSGIEVTKKEKKETFESERIKYHNL